MRKKRAARFTTTPDTPAPELYCLVCHEHLAYRQTVYSGVNPVERWDQLECPTCGAYDFRHRTHTLRRRAVDGVTHQARRPK
jgi:hypothetical protein